MVRSNRVVRSAGVAVGAAALATALGATGAFASTSIFATAKVDKALAARVLPAIRHTGVLVVAADATYAPNEFVVGGKVVGMDADLAQAIGRVLRLKVKMVNETFDGIIPGLAAHKYDLGMSSFTDTKAREKTVDFVDYFSAGTSFFVKAHGGPNVKNLAGLCGLSVAVETGTTQQADATAQKAKCAAAGHKPVTVDAYADQNSANLALASGRDQVGMADSPVAAYQVKQSKGAFRLSGKAYGTAPYGIAIPKHDKMAPVVLGAIKDLKADGTYLKIMKKWGIQAGAVAAFKVNGATS